MSFNNFVIPICLKFSTSVCLIHLIQFRSLTSLSVIFECWFILGLQLIGIHSPTDLFQSFNQTQLTTTIKSQIPHTQVSNTFVTYDFRYGIFPDRRLPMASSLWPVSIIIVEPWVFSNSFPNSILNSLQTASVWYDRARRVTQYCSKVLSCARAPPSHCVGPLEAERVVFRKTTKTRTSSLILQRQTKIHVAQ